MKFSKNKRILSAVLGLSLSMTPLLGSAAEYATVKGGGLNLRETANILGFKDTRTVKKMFPFVDGYITLPTLARCLTPRNAENSEI